MTTIVITKRDDGKLGGFTPADQRAYARFKQSIDALEVGELFQLSTWFPRNPTLHKTHFVIIGRLFDAQEQFTDPDRLRAWLYVGAGFCDYAPGRDGVMVAIPRSVRYDKMDDAEFYELHRNMLDFLRGEHAQRFLWPYLRLEQTWETVEMIVGRN